MKKKDETYVHGEINVRVVVCEHIAYCLVQHGEQGTQCPHPREVHDVLQALGVFHTLDDKAI